METTTQFDTQRVGALPVIAEFCERLHLGRLINEIVPWQGDVPLGDIVEILLANRLLDPKPMYKLGSWATSNFSEFLQSDRGKITRRLYRSGLGTHRRSWGQRSIGPGAADHPAIQAGCPPGSLRYVHHRTLRLV